MVPCASGSSQCPADSEHLHTEGPVFFVRHSLRRMCRKLFTETKLASFICVLEESHGGSGSQSGKDHKQFRHDCVLAVALLPRRRMLKSVQCSFRLGPVVPQGVSHAVMSCVGFRQCHRMYTLESWLAAMIQADAQGLAPMRVWRLMVVGGRNMQRKTEEPNSLHSCFPSPSISNPTTDGPLPLASPQYTRKQVSSHLHELVDGLINRYHDVRQCVMVVKRRKTSNLAAMFSPRARDEMALETFTLH